MINDICVVEGCNRVRDKNQNRLICQLHRSRMSKYNSYELPTAPELAEGVLKICKKHGELTALGVYKRVKGKDWLSCRICVKECGTRFREKHSSVFLNDYRKNYTIHKSKIKVSKELFEHLLKEQNNVCAICNNPESIISGHVNRVPKRMAIDHDHTTGKIRGLLCHQCNVSIGAMQESIELLQAAINYLQKHKAE
jgi:hypothetical protein